MSLLAIAGKVLAKILLMRLNRNLFEKVCPETQFGFRSERGTIDMVIIARQLQEKSREQQRSICMAFIDLTKAFDTVNRDLLWFVLGKFGCPDKFIAMARAFHWYACKCGGWRWGDHALFSGGWSQAGPRDSSGVVQSLPGRRYRDLSRYNPHFHDIIPTGHGIKINYRLDGSLFNLRRLQARTKVSHDGIFELQYVDD